MNTAGNAWQSGEAKAELTDVIDVLERPVHPTRCAIVHRSDNGPEFVAQAVRTGSTLSVPRPPTSNQAAPWENGYCESFNARFSDELLNGEIFYSLREAQILIEQWRKHYNTKRPAQCSGLPPTGPGNHRPDGPKAGHALTIKPDHSGGADQEAGIAPRCRSHGYSRSSTQTNQAEIG
jgi:transposase InsO family protein